MESVVCTLDSLPVATAISSLLTVAIIACEQRLTLVGGKRGNMSLPHDEGAGDHAAHSKPLRHDIEPQAERRRVVVPGRHENVCEDREQRAGEREVVQLPCLPHHPGSMDMM